MFGSQLTDSLRVSLEEMSRPDIAPHHAFVRFIGEFPEQERSDRTPNHDKDGFSDADSYREEEKYSDNGSIRSIGEGRLGSDPEEYDRDAPYFNNSAHETPDNADTTQNLSKTKTARNYAPAMCGSDWAGTEPTLTKN